MTDSVARKSKPIPEGVNEIVGVLNGFNSLVVLNDGSLLSNTELVSGDKGLTWEERRPFGEGVAGHGHVPEYFGAGFSWSDDEGKTWTYGTYQKLPNILMGWFDFNGEPNGMCGITPFGEASIAETKDDRIIIFGRTTTGRIAYSYSRDRGEKWAALLPTGLAASNSPARLRRIPGTGDLLCVWNQVSAEEIRRGYRRSRLSAGFSYFHYANVRFVEDKVSVMYSRGYPEMGIAEQLVDKQEKVMRINPLDWFYSAE